MSDTVVALHLDDDNPWPGLAHYTEASQDYFHGRDRDVADLLQLLRLSPSSCCTASRGWAKSSMLQAGALRLRDALFLPVPRLNYAEGAEPPLHQALTRLMQKLPSPAVTPTPGPNESLWRTSSGASGRSDCRKLPLTPVLVFDSLRRCFPTVARPSTSSGFWTAWPTSLVTACPAHWPTTPAPPERLNLRRSNTASCCLSVRTSLTRSRVGAAGRLPKHEALDLKPMTPKLAIAAVGRRARPSEGLAEEIVNFVLGR
jgi:hypothetical protein